MVDGRSHGKYTTDFINRISECKTNRMKCSCSIGVDSDLGFVCEWMWSCIVRNVNRSFICCVKCGDWARECTKKIVIVPICSENEAFIKAEQPKQNQLQNTVKGFSFIFGSYSVRHMCIEHLNIIEKCGQFSVHKFSIQHFLSVGE